MRLTKAQLRAKERHEQRWNRSQRATGEELDALVDNAATRALRRMSQRPFGDDNSLVAWNTRWRNVLRRDPCAYCGGRTRKMTIDHVDPRSLGGEESAVTNGSGACGPCNRAKSNATLLAFLASGAMGRRPRMEKRCRLAPRVRPRGYGCVVDVWRRAPVGVVEGRKARREYWAWFDGEGEGSDAP